jgi:hypothetical protein
MRFCEGWKQTQLQPLSCPSKTLIHSISTPIKELKFLVSVSFFFKTVKSQMRTVESNDAETIRFF